MNLINNPRMFNGAIVDLAEKPYIPQKIYFNEFVANVMRDVRGIFFLTSEVMEAPRDQKHPSEAKNGMKELIYRKKCLMKVAQQPQKPSDGSNQI